MTKHTQPALFLDRDGTLIVDADYPKDPQVVLMMDGAASCLKSMRQQGFALVVISNQSGIGRGIIQPSQAQAVHERFLQVFAQQGVTFQGVYYCPHAPEAGCLCRKPNPGLLRQAADELGLSLSHSFMVGDKLADVEAGQRAGGRGILFRRTAGDPESGIIPDAVARTWDEVRQYIQKQVNAMQ